MIRAHTLYQKSIACLLLGLLSFHPASAACNAELYPLFKHYRERINTAERLQDLAVFFSHRFNAYYLSRIGAAKKDNRYLNQYWQNLNTARDLVISYSQQQRCQQHKAKLSIIGILQLAGQRQGDTLDLWRLDVDYVWEDKQWKIDAFEYNLEPPQRQHHSAYGVAQILDNFTQIQSN